MDVGVGESKRREDTNTISQGLITLNLDSVMNAEDRDDWRRRTRVADPSLERFTA